MSCPIRPLADRLICIKTPAEEVRASGIVVPQMFDDQEEAEVVAVGPGKQVSADERVPMNVRVGDRILFNKFQVQAIAYEGVDYIGLKDEDVRAVLNR